MSTNSPQNGHASPHHAERSNWLLVGVLCFIGMLNYGVRTSITAIFPLLKSDLGFTDIGLGAIGSFFLWSYAIASPFAGHFSDRFDRRRIVIASLIGWSLVTTATGFVHSARELLALRVLLGLVESFYLPAALSLVGESHSGRTVATAMSILTFGQSFGMVGGTTLAGYLGDHFGWRPSVWVFGLTGLLLAIPASFLIGKRKQAQSIPAPSPSTTGPKRESSIADDILHLAKIPSFWVLAAAGALTAISAWIFLNWLPLYFKESFSMSLAVAGFFGATFFNASSAISGFFGGVVSDRVARRGEHKRMLLQAILISSAAPLSLVFVFTKNLWLTVISLALFALFRSSADVNIMPLICEIAGEKRSSIAFGITNMLNCLLGGMGIFVAGALKSTMGLRGVFAGAVGILVLDGLMLFMGYRMFLKKDLELAMLPEMEPVEL